MSVKINTKNIINRGVIYSLGLILISLFIFSSNVKALSIAVSTDELTGLQDEIKDKQKQIEELNKQKEIYEQNLNKSRQQISSLNSQINDIDQVASKINIEIQTIGLEKESVNLQVKELNLVLTENEEEIEDQEDKITMLLRTLNANSHQSKLANFISTKGSIGDFFSYLNELNKIHSGLQVELESLTEKKNELSRQKNLLIQKNDQLEDLNNRLNANKEKLDSEKVVKDSILRATKGEESKYADLVARLKAEQQAINNEIYSLEIEARKRLYELKGEEFLASEKGYIWPVPSRRVTAYFHDPDYPYRHIFEHPAIDIGSTPQGTPVRAIKSGYVAKVRNTGNTGGYNYIMLVHSEGMSSVYGHMNRMIVAEDTFVVQGEIIGYSGGMPGTAGAGALTSGPHLHLEIRQNGIPVNALNYLP
ncbi:peptidoglycan DD-metalloendopeptidase family protein [Patescibacteria group bacterium]|nr:peptidoglycan DD-metalloendopeptidase family protein [Patescibacteria group bacterium]